MDSRKIAKRYAKAFLENFPHPDDAFNSLGELEIILDIITTSEELSELLDYPNISQLAELFRKSVQLDKYSEKTRKFVELLIESERLKLLSIIIADFEEMLWRSQDVNFVRVQSTHTLSKQTLTKLKDKLREKLGGEVEMKNELVTDLIGSIKLKMGDRVIDGSIKGKLERMKISILQSVKEQA